MLYGIRACTVLTCVFCFAFRWLTRWLTRDQGNTGAVDLNSYSIVTPLYQLNFGDWWCKFFCSPFLISSTHFVFDTVHHVNGVSMVVRKTSAELLKVLVYSATISHQPLVITLICECLEAFQISMGVPHLVQKTCRWNLHCRSCFQPSKDFVVLRRTRHVGLARW